jgi:flagellin
MSIGDFSSNLRVSLNNFSQQLSNSFQKLASGKRINKASDDAAGLAIVSALESDVSTELQGARNANDGQSIADIADSALGAVSDITTRQQELASESANGTLSDQQRTTLNDEFQSLEQEKSQIFSTTQFNGVSVFNGQGTTLQVGTTGGANSQITLPSGDTSTLSSAQDISTQGGAQSAIDALNTHSQNISSLRGQVGAVSSRIDAASENARNNAVESESAASRIRDVDVAEEKSNEVGASIRQQATTALIAQASQLSAQSVLKLLS